VCSHTRASAILGRVLECTRPYLGIKRVTGPLRILLFYVAWQHSGVSTLAGIDAGYNVIISTERIVNLIESGWPVQVPSTGTGTGDNMLSFGKSCS